MLAARNQENLVYSHQNGAALKQQQQQGQRSKYPNTPIKVPLKDENVTHAIGGAKSVLGGRSRGNENVLTSKGQKGLDKSNFVTPMQPRSRAVLGDKTTNAKAQAQQTVNGKTQTKAPNTSKPKQKQPQAESLKLSIHADNSNPFSSEEEVEYCPPKPKDLPYESDVFPDGVLTFDALKPENRLKGFYSYYFNPVDENGVSLADKQLEKKNKKALEDGERLIQEDMENLQWDIEDELEVEDKGTKKTPAPTRAPSRLAVPKQSIPRKAPSTIRSRNAAAALSMDDRTNSLQRKAAKVSPTTKPAKKRTSFATGVALRASRKPDAPPAGPKRTPLEARNIEVNSRATIGYSKGRATASMLARGTTTRPIARPQKAKAAAAATPKIHPRSNDTADSTITPARYAHEQAAAAVAEDQEWKARVPFLSIFSPEDDDDDDCDDLLLGGGLPPSMTGDEDEEVEEEFEIKLLD